VGQTLHSILAEVLLCAVVATGLTISCLPRGTCCRCYSVFVSTAVVVFPSVEADAVVASTVEATALIVLTHADEGPPLLVEALLWLLFPTQFAAA
jgi:hypothetical protein